jgi:DNA mismatch endonuclease (patch repair protein)
MADVHNKETRSYNMKCIRSKDTKPELIVRKFLFAKGYRFRLHSKSLPGKPDIVLPKYRIAIFVHGCFWHGHEGCRYFIVPKTRTKWWFEKINRNIEKDKTNTSLLRKMNWRVIIIWGCKLIPKVRDSTLSTLNKRVSKYSLGTS